MVSVSSGDNASSATNVRVLFSVNGVTIADSRTQVDSSSYNAIANTTVIVPSGSTYGALSVSSNNLKYWLELK